MRPGLLGPSTFLTCTLLLLSRVAAAQSPTVTLLDTAVLAAPRLYESSGIAASRRDPGVYWTHNDSGDGPFLYTTDSTGRDLGRVRVEGAGAVDWEDVAPGPCADGGPCLYIGDIGDDLQRREHVTLYVVAEPDPPRSPADTARSVPLLYSIVLRYPDHPHDAEALAVTRGGWLLIVTKPLLGSPLLYRASLAPASARTLELVGPLPIAVSAPRGRLVTGAATSPDGRWLVVRTYVSLHFFALSDNATVSPVTGERGIGVPVVEAQGEGVAFDGSARLVLTSERGFSGHAILTRLALRGLSAPAP